MILDIVIMSYALLMAILIFQAEKLPQNSFKIILIGLFLTPIIGFLLLGRYKTELKKSVS
jgi:positive regulator of sigma E activity